MTAPGSVEFDHDRSLGGIKKLVEIGLLHIFIVQSRRATEEQSCHCENTNLSHRHVGCNSRSESRSLLKRGKEWV